MLRTLSWKKKLVLPPRLGSSLLAHSQSQTPSVSTNTSLSREASPTTFPLLSYLHIHSLRFAFPCSVCAGTPPCFFSCYLLVEPPHQECPCSELPSYFLGSSIHATRFASGFDANVFVCSAVVAVRGLNLFGKIKDCVGLCPDVISLVNLLPACAGVGAALQVDMYAKCEMMDEANRVFEKMKVKDVVSWNSMVTGYSQVGRFEDALILFKRMWDDNIELNVITWSAVITGYAQRGLGLETMDVFQKMQFCGSVPNVVTLVSLLSGSNPGDDLMVINALADMYAKCKSFKIAGAMFDRITQKDRSVVTWTAMIGDYAQYGDANDALELFYEMLQQDKPMIPNAFTISCALMACARLGALRSGQQIHAYVLRNRYESVMLFVANCPIDMYSKSGDVDSARLAMACINYFNNMGKEFGIVPAVGHYVCMVDLLGCAGRLDEAMQLIKYMPMEPSPTAWVAVLKNDGPYKLLSNIYASARRWKDVARIRSLMKYVGIRKRPSCSWAQGKEGTASFFVGDRSHPQSPQMYELLANLLWRIRAMGYRPGTHDVDDEEKGDLLLELGEKLALAYGILNSFPGATIRITKNLCVCGDCHSAITFISKIVDHKIILRHASHFHHFENGSCSCKGFW
ncbi:Pentatricopeptide repeat [Dillenia turbinata]|uniref:Pentatricopeptide repeat n=1 Tax=Dillenia turbinata TaxID=194707 RepID=A0AAN8VBD4_9MAGN